MLNLKRKIWVIIGTRPEYIKQLPVYYECLKKIGKKNVLLVNSGQHKNFLNFYSKENKTRFDIQVNNLQSTKSLTKNIKKSIEIFYQLIRKNNPEIVIVQGDTTSSAAFAYAAKLNGVTVIHNEAGLRTFDKKVLRIIILSSVLKLFSFRMFIILFLFFAKQLSISSDTL